MSQSFNLGKVVVIMGGTAAEREISLQSGQAVYQALLDAGVDVVRFDYNGKNTAELMALDCDIAFNIVHGRGGEDGCLQGLLECIGIQYTGSNVQTSAITMDKLATKQVWMASSLPTPAYSDCSHEINHHQIKQLGLPLVIKPVREGSSIGISLVKALDDLEQAIKEAKQFDKKVIAEQWIDGEEYTVAILNDKALPVIRLQTNHDFYDYKAKYESNATLYHCPCGLADDQELMMQELALKAYKQLECSGWARIDFMRDQQGNNWLIEVNTVPGMTSHSLVPMAAKQAGLNFQQLVIEILKAAQVRDKK